MIDFLTGPNFLLFLGNVLSMALYSYMQRTFYKRKDWFERHWWTLVLLYGAIAVSWFGVNMLGYPPLNFISYILAFMIPLFICYEVKNWRGIAYYAFYTVGMLTSEICLGLISGVLTDKVGMTTRYDVITPEVALIMNMAEVIIVLLICHFGNKDKDKRFDKVTRLFMTMPVFSVVIIVADMCMIGLGKAPQFNQGQFLRMAILLVVVNIVIFVTLEKYTALMKKDFLLAQHEMKLQSDAEMLEMAAKAMSDRLSNAEAVMQAERTMRHDRRHFEALLVSLLEEGRVEEARKYLEERLAQEPHATVRYCDNTTVNAALTYYVSMAQRKGIKVYVSTNIPARLQIDEMQLAIAISNLIENAILACEKLPQEQRYIKVNAKYKNQLLLEIENPCCGTVQMAEDGCPMAKEEGHGTGSRSVYAFAEATDSELRYIAEENKFTVRMIIQA